MDTSLQIQRIKDGYQIYEFRKAHAMTINLKYLHQH